MWQPNLEAHLSWWKKIVAARRADECELMPITPEFGPSPYMTLLPHTQRPIADLWEINVFIREWLKEQLQQS
jgi:hypothetical protein